MTNIIASGLETSVDVAAVAAIGGFLAVIYVIGLLSNYLQAFLFTTAIQRFSERLRRAIAEKINSLPWDILMDTLRRYLISCNQ